MVGRLLLHCVGPTGGRGSRRLISALGSLLTGARVLVGRLLLHCIPGLPGRRACRHTECGHCLRVNSSACLKALLLLERDQSLRGLLIQYPIGLALIEPSFSKDDLHLPDFIRTEIYDPRGVPYLRAAGIIRSRTSSAG